LNKKKTYILLVTVLAIWGTIGYKIINGINPGLVKKQNSAEKVFVVNINNKQYLLKQGQTIDSVTLVKGNTKQIVMRYQNKLQTVKRQ